MSPVCQFEMTLPADFAGDVWGDGASNRTFDKLRQVAPGAIADNKRLGAVLAMIRNQQPRRGSEGRSGPRRHDQLALAR